MQIPTCPACDEPGVLVGGEVIYPHRPDWGCPEDQWHWDKLTELMEILESEEG